MKPESKKRLEEFVKRAEYIRQLHYLDGGKNIVGFIAGEHETTFNQPDNEKRDALLFNLRLFVQDKDDISLHRMSELYDDPGITDLWKQEHNKERAILKIRLSQVISNSATKGILTNDDVFRMFLFGERGHFDQDDKAYKIYKKWVTDETVWALLHNTFHETILWVLRAIINIGVASKEELQRHAVAGSLLAPKIRG
jgi:hypothetical protein